MQDTRILDIRSLIESGDYDLLSLDIFDTVVWRMVPEPIDVFFLVADHIARNGWMHDSSSRESFVRERIGAERRARKKTSSLEVTLDEIYREFPRGYLREISPRRAASLEFEVEKGLVRVNPDVRSIIDLARERGLDVAFVSDTYFTPPQVHELVGIDVDHMVLSCQERVSKYHGLHGRLIDKAGVQPSRILHVGNDFYADVEGPGVFNIERYWFRIFPQEYEGLIQLELPSTLSSRASYIRSNDHGLMATRSRSMFLSSDAYERWGAGILGPVVVGFCEWVDQKCKRLGIDVALCLMREGRVFKNVLETLGSSLETKEFFVSRYAARKATIFEATEGELEGFVFRPSPQKRGSILRQLGLTAQDIGGDPEVQLTPEETTKLIRKVSASRRLREKVVRDSARAREGLLAHLRDVLGDERPSRVAVVDLGYKGTIQECLHTILEHEGMEVGTHGLYLVTGGEVQETQASGAVVEGWLADNGQPIAMAHTFMRSPEVFEQSLMAQCGTTMGYTPEGEPVLDDFRAPAEQRGQISAVQRGLISYAAEWKRQSEAHGIADSGDLKVLYQAICIRSVARPLDVELELFGGWQHDENFGSGRARGLTTVEEMDEWERSHISAHQLASLPMSRVYWPFGFARRISPTMGEAVTNIYLRTVEPEVFESAQEQQYMMVYWDTGNGFNQEESRVQPYRLNNRGRVWQRFTMHPQNGGAARSVGFTIGLKDQVVQLTGVRIQATSRDGQKAALSLPHESIEKLGYDRLHDNLYLVKEDPALLVLPTEDMIEEAVRVDIDLFFGLVLED